MLDYFKNWSLFPILRTFLNYFVMDKFSEGPVLTKIL